MEMEGVVGGRREFERLHTGDFCLAVLCLVAADIDMTATEKLMGLQLEHSIALVHMQPVRRRKPA